MEVVPISITLKITRLISILSVLSNLSNKINNLVSCVELKCKDNVLQFVVISDAVFCVEKYPDAMDAKDFSCFIDIYKIYNIIRNCPGDQVTLKIDNKMLNIIAVNTHFSINIIEGMEFRMPNIQGYLFNFNISAKQLVELINNVEFCALQKTIGSNLSAISFQYDYQKKRLVVVGVDGHRLGVSSTDLQVDKDSDWMILVSLYIVQKIQVFLNNMLDEDICINIAQNSIVIESSCKKGVFALMNDSFPAYKHLIPENNNSLLSCNTNYFLMILRRITAISNQSMKVICIAFNEVNAVINMQESFDNYNNISKEVITYDNSFTYQGDKLEIALNADYIMQVLNRFKNSTITLHIKDAYTAVLIICNEDVKYVVMPLKI